MEPFVSCVICAHNYEAYVAEAVESALAQDYPRDRFEVVVIDDGSTDRTPEVLASFGDAIRVVRQDNAGLTAATTRGIREARGELIALLDADDAWRPDKLRRQVPLFERPEVGLAFTDKELVDGRGQRLHPSFFAYYGYEIDVTAPLGELLRRNFVPAPTIMFRASLADHVLPVAEEAIYQDWWLAVQIGRVAELAWVDAPLTRYRIHGDNMLGGAASDRRAELVRRDNVFRRHLLRRDWLDEVDPVDCYRAFGNYLSTVSWVAERAKTLRGDEIAVTDADRAEAAARVAAARAAEAAGDLDTAVRRWANARGADPLEPVYELGLDAAVAALISARGEGPPPPVPSLPTGDAERLAWAEARFEGGDPGAAIEVLMDLAETAADPAHAVAARADLAVIALSLGDADTARRIAGETLALDGDNAAALEVLATAATADDDHVQAAHFLRRAAAAAPADAGVRRALGAAEAERAHWPQALAALREAQAIEPLDARHEELLATAVARVASAAAAPTPAVAERGRVLVCVDYFHPSVGGSERLAEGVGVALGKLGWSVEIACRALPERTGSRHRGMRIHEVRERPREELAALVARRGYDAVLAFSDPHSWPVPAAMRLGSSGPRVVAVPCVMPHNEGFVRENVENLRGWRELLEGIHAPVHSSHGGRDARLHADLDLDAEYVPNASEEIPPLGSLRAGLGLDADVPLLLQVSNFWTQKNHLGLLEALEHHPGDFRLAMVGGPAPGNDELAREIIRRAAADPRVIVTGGLPGELVSAGMREADLLVHPSISEGAPITVLEAMSAGLPWVATPGCSAVHDHAGGLILPVRQFGDAIDFLLAHPEHRASLAAAGREHWEHAYTYEVVASRYDTLLRGGRGLPELVQPAAALAATGAIRAAFYDAATVAGTQVAAYA